MFILGVGGLSSGVGKTALICRLADALPGWGALKTSVSDAHRKGRGGSGRAIPDRFEVLEDPGILERPGTDTARFLDAGYARVAWLRTRKDAVRYGIVAGLARFGDLPGVIVEGNSFAMHTAVDACILVARSGLNEVKESARALLPRVEWTVLNRSGSGDDPSEVKSLRERLGEPCTAPIRIVDAESSGDPGAQRLVDDIRVFFRR